MSGRETWKGPQETVPAADESAHRLARTLFQLRLNLKALAAATSDDGAIAHPSGISINHTAFHSDALDAVCASGVSHLRASRNQVVVCLQAVSAKGEREIESALSAIQTNFERVAHHLAARPFTNDRRMMVSMICDEICDLCALAIQNFAVHHFTKIER
jgi:hypothetical protein